MADTHNESLFFRFSDSLLKQFAAISGSILVGSLAELHMKQNIIIGTCHQLKVMHCTVCMQAAKHKEFIK